MASGTVLSCLGFSEQPDLLHCLREVSGWLKASPTMQKASDQLESPLVSEAVPESRQTSGGSRRECWRRYDDPFLAACVFAKVHLARGHSRDVRKKDISTDVL